jgi:hypothetical protein
MTQAELCQLAARRLLTLSDQRDHGHADDLPQLAATAHRHAQEGRSR